MLLSKQRKHEYSLKDELGMFPLKFHYHVWWMSEKRRCE